MVTTGSRCGLEDAAYHQASEALRQDLSSNTEVRLKLVKSSRPFASIHCNEKTPPISDRAHTLHEWTGRLNRDKSLGHLPSLFHQMIAASSWSHSLPVSNQLLSHLECGDWLFATEQLVKILVTECHCQLQAPLFQQRYCELGGDQHWHTGTRQPVAGSRLFGHRTFDTPRTSATLEAVKPLATLSHDHIKYRREQKSEHGHAEHAGKHGRAERLAHFGARTRRAHQRQHTKDKGE